MREVLLTTNLAEEETWTDFTDVIDEVWASNIDNPLKVFPTLRNTYSFEPTIFSVQDQSRYVSDIPVAFSSTQYQTEINLMDAESTIFIVKRTKAIPNSMANNNLDSVVKLTLGTGTDQYLIRSENIFEISTPLIANESLEVISYRQNTFDLSDYYNYGTDIVSGLFQLDFPNDNILNIETAINLNTGLPANMFTGAPYNLLIVYLKIADGSFQYLPPNAYKIISPTEIQFLILPYNPVDPGNPGQYLISEFTIVARQPAVEVTKKLNQLGFTYSNIEYVTRPAYFDNAHIIQAMADNYSSYAFNTSGTPYFMDFFQYASNSSFKLFKLWAQDNGDLTIYDNLTREQFLPFGYSKVYEVPAGSGGWYPTSHVDLFYDIFTYGTLVDPEEVKKFFNYVSPINLVLNNIVFGGDVPPSTLSTIYIGGGLDCKIIYE